jgi:hypothetical protein
MFFFTLPSSRQQLGLLLPLPATGVRAWNPPLNKKIGDGLSPWFSFHFFFTSSSLHLTSDQGLGIWWAIKNGIIS